MARILLIDDDETLLGLLEQALIDMGHSVVTATDGAKGEKLFRAQPFEVILTDLVMPNREGLETIITLRREFPHVAVIAMTGVFIRSKAYLELAERLGAHRVLQKPFPLQALRDAIDSLL